MSDAILVGPLCRLFAIDAETARERVAGIERWWSDVGAALSGRVPVSLPWIEDGDLEPRRIGLPERGLDAVRFVAVHAARPELELPDALPDPLWTDPDWRRAQESRFARSPYGHLLAAEAWLPIDFDFTFVVPRPDGADWSIGSSFALRDQLGFLSQRTFGCSPASLAEAHRLAVPLLATAGAALFALGGAVAAAIASRLPLVVPFRA
ncbi:MAG: hypothetical protein HZB39_16595 [Planctomycetes bacterium]|nr:hypothetical protein [Planctomycetota bacterium]